MDPEQPSINISDVVLSTTGRDKGKIFYVIGTEGDLLLLANGKDRTMDKPKRKKQKHVQKVLRSETRVAAKLINGDKVLNSELRKELAFMSREMQSNDLGG